MIPGSANSLLLASAGEAGAYFIPRSVRLNSADSAYLSRTPSTAGNRKTWTWAGWVKLGGATRNWLFSASETVNSAIEVFSNGRLYVYHGSGSPGYVGWSGVLRDYSAWYHLVVTVDTTQATSTNRVKAYINGNQITFDEGAQPAQNSEPTNGINSTSLHNICRQFSGSAYTVNCYLADIHFIDGQALDPTSFGEFDANGIWQPIDASGLTYGINGFHLTFSDNSTAASLGDDTSGNNNDWTVNNISVAAGAGNDSLVDVPTNGTASSGGDAGGVTRGNYCTWNPLINGDTAANGNLDVTNDTARGTHKLLDYDAYWEITSTGGTTTAGVVSDGGTTNTTTVADTKTYGFKLSAAGSLDYINITDGGSFVNITTGLTGVQFPYASAASATTGSLNAGQRPFAASAPAGFKGICTANLPSTTIATSGSYIGNGVADGPFVFLNGVPTAMTIGGNSVTFGTDADKLSNGFKIRTTSTTFNQNASTYNYSITSTGDPFKTARAQAN